MTEQEIQATIHEEKSATLDKLIPAIIKAKPEFDAVKRSTAVKRSAKGFEYKYADLETVIKSISESLQNNNLLVQQMTSIVNDKHVIITYLFHESGQYFKSTMHIELDKIVSSNKYQDFGSAMSYMRRYAILLILGIAQEDDDAASQTVKIIHVEEEIKSLPVKEATQVTQVQELSKEHEESLNTLKSLCEIQNINSVEFCKKFDIRKSDLESIKRGIKNFPEYSSELLNSGAKLS